MLFIFPFLSLSIVGVQCNHKIIHSSTGIDASGLFPVHSGTMKALYHWLVFKHSENNHTFPLPELGGWCYCCFYPCYSSSFSAELEYPGVTLHYNKHSTPLRFCFGMSSCRSWCSNVNLCSHRPHPKEASINCFSSSMLCLAHLSCFISFSLFFPVKMHCPPPPPTWLICSMPC